VRQHPGTARRAFDLVDASQQGASSMRQRAERGAERFVPRHRPFQDHRRVAFALDLIDQPAGHAGAVRRRRGRPQAPENRVKPCRMRLSVLLHAARKRSERTAAVGPTRQRRPPLRQQFGKRHVRGQARIGVAAQSRELAPAHEAGRGNRSAVDRDVDQFVELGHLPVRQRTGCHHAAHVPVETTIAAAWARTWRARQAHIDQIAGL
jgi:hypothetical protein